MLCGTVNTTHLVGFQEPNEFAAIESNNITLERLKRRTIKHVEKKNSSCAGIDPKKEPPILEINKHSASKDFQQINLQ